ncbi:MAG: dihydropteroate synthase [Elusimicrobia bacterium]|nr:dihydropteroate synthase [Elusimicrobiota bacterium]
MGILNVTPDSFYDGGQSLSLEEAVSRGLDLVVQGADIVDVGGESTRPGAECISVEEELRRVLPVVKALSKKVRVPLSIDTTKSEVARQSLESGASLINDISALRDDPRMVEVVVSYGVPLLLMHRQGANAKTMQKNPVYKDVVLEVLEFFQERVAFFREQGGEPRQILLDPGIGFGKKLEHNLALLRSLKRLKSLGFPLVLGASRKSFLGRLLAQDVEEKMATSELPLPAERLEGSLAVACWAAAQKVDILRVHDVRATRRALQVWQAVASVKAEAKFEVPGSKF